MEEGFLLVNKPAGMSSFAVVKKCRYLSGVKKVGHAGTLDPFATGLLILALGKTYTRRISEFVNLEKSYEGVVQFGIETDSYDSDGEILKELAVPEGFSLTTIEEQKDQFLGEIQQVPPVFSAKKVNGQRSYALARKGKAVTLEPQTVSVFDFDFLNYSEGDFPELAIRLRCSKGTYVRSIAHDLGLASGTCAYLKSLRRTHIGDYSHEDALDFDTLSKETIQDALFTI